VHLLSLVGWLWLLLILVENYRVVFSVHDITLLHLSDT
jgi:hypothetical protein